MRIHKNTLVLLFAGVIFGFERSFAANPKGSLPDTYQMGYNDGVRAALNDVRIIKKLLIKNRFSCFLYKKILPGYLAVYGLLWLTGNFIKGDIYVYKITKKQVVFWAYSAMYAILLAVGIDLYITLN